MKLLIKQQKSTKSKEKFREIKASYNDKKEWKYDPKGYFLIHINKKTKRIEVAHCRRNNIVEVKITGKNAREIYNTIIKEELISSLQHAAYLGRELTLAEHALKNNTEYVQDNSYDKLLKK